MAERGRFISGVIEGFYGKPWSQGERFDLFERMAEWGFNTYLYAPKDDLKHRAIWREKYSEAEAAELRAVIAECQRRGVEFVYGIGPGLDIAFSHESDLLRLKLRFDQLLGMGCRSFAVLFDDIPDRMREDDAKRFGTFAKAQAFVANALHKWLNDRDAGGRFLFCPTPYCWRMASRELGGAGYLETIGRELAPEIDVFWTGPEIISETISVEHIREVAVKLLRKPVLWDNLHANDYDGRRFFCGPYSGRPPELLREVKGILTNPNCEYPLNFVPLQTLSWYVKGEQFEPRLAYLGALDLWRAKWQVTQGAPAAADLVLLADCFYLPFEDGDHAYALWDRAADAVAAPEQAEYFLKDAARLREFCGRLAELKDRNLFYALSRRIWELREELDLLEKFVRFKMDPANASAAFHSDFHLPKTYRGGFVPRLQRLLRQNDDGSIDVDMGKNG
jgi:protein O-GlcNAcase/histone acetyltransferase